MGPEFGTETPDPPLDEDFIPLQHEGSSAVKPQFSNTLALQPRVKRAARFQEEEQHRAAKRAKMDPIPEESGGPPSARGLLVAHPHEDQPVQQPLDWQLQAHYPYPYVPYPVPFVQYPFPVFLGYYGGKEGSRRKIAAHLFQRIST